MMAAVLIGLGLLYALTMLAGALDALWEHRR